MTYDHSVTGQVIRKLREKLRCLQGKNSARRQPSPLHLTKNHYYSTISSQNRPKTQEKTTISGGSSKLMTRFELVTSSLPRMRSTD